MPDLGVPELLIIAVIVLLLFGPTKAGDIGGALGKSIRAFRQESREDGDPHVRTQISAPGLDISAAPSANASPVPGSESATSARPAFCTECGNRLEESHKFCVACGQPVMAAVP